MTVAPGQPGFPRSRMAEKHRRSSLWLWNTAAAGHRGIRTEKRLATASGATVATARFSLSYNCNLLIQSPSVGNAAAAPTGSVNGVPSYHRAPASIECCVNRGAVRRPLLNLTEYYVMPVASIFFPTYSVSFCNLLPETGKCGNSFPYNSYSYQKPHQHAVFQRFALRAINTHSLP